MYLVIQRKLLKYDSYTYNKFFSFIDALNYASKIDDDIIIKKDDKIIAKLNKIN